MAKPISPEKKSLIESVLRGQGDFAELDPKKFQAGQTGDARADINVKEITRYIIDDGGAETDGSNDPRLRTPEYEIMQSDTADALGFLNVGSRGQVAHAAIEVFLTDPDPYLKYLKGQENRSRMDDTIIASIVEQLFPHIPRDYEFSKEEVDTILREVYSKSRKPDANTITFSLRGVNDGNPITLPLGEHKPYLAGIDTGILNVKDLKGFCKEADISVNDQTYCSDLEKELSIAQDTADKCADEIREAVFSPKQAINPLAPYFVGVEDGAKDYPAPTLEELSQKLQTEIKPIVQAGHCLKPDAQGNEVSQSTPIQGGDDVASSSAPTTPAKPAPLKDVSPTYITKPEPGGRQ